MLSELPPSARAERAEVRRQPAAELLIVADPDDPVAAEVADYMVECGRRAVVLDPFDSAQLFTVSVRDGRAVVDPEVPMFLRMPALPTPRPSFDAQFQYHECLAQIWAAAALTPAPVINRPTARSLGSLVSDSAALTELRVTEPVSSVEVFSSTFPDPVGRAGEQWWVADVDTAATAAWPERPRGQGPFRARWSAADPAFEVVVVLAENAWRCTTAELDHLHLRDRSVALTAKSGLALAAVTWRIDAGARAAHLVTIDPFPGVELLHMTWLGLGPRMLEVFFP